MVLCVRTFTVLEGLRAILNDFSFTGPQGNFERLLVLQGQGNFERILQGPRAILKDF